MRYRAFANGEPQYGQNQQNFLQGIDAVAQAIKTSLQLYTGEWWEDLNDGLPLFTKIIGYGGSNKNQINAIIQARILSIQLNGQSLVNSVSNVSNNYDSVTRAYSFTGSAKSIYGYITVSNARS